MWKYILIIILGITIFSCNTPITKSEFSDKAELRRFKVETITNKTSSGYLFFFMGGYSASESNVSKIKFYAKNRFDEYCLFEFSLSDVKIKLDSTVVNAYVEFKMNDYLMSGKSTATGYSDSLDYDKILYIVRNYDYIKAIITCNPKDFPENINLDQL